jgi:hypothetical protein
MRSSLRHGALALALFGSVGLAAAADNADSGKINNGAAEAQQPPAGGPPNQAEQPGSGDIVTNGPPMGEAPPAATSAAAAAPRDNMGAAPSGPIGSTPQTMPSKYSGDNDVADKRPIMAHPLALTDAQKRQIYDGVASNRDAAVHSVDARVASILPGDVTLYELPSSLVEAIPAVRGYKYVKFDDKVLLVNPPNRIVVGEIAK